MTNVVCFVLFVVMLLAGGELSSVRAIRAQRPARYTGEWGVVVAASRIRFGLRVQVGIQRY